MQTLIKFTNNRVWRTYQGGKLLDIIEGKSQAQDTHFPEDWIGSTVEAKNIGREDISEGLAKAILDNGETILFKELIAQNVEYYLGSEQGLSLALDDIPLVKYLDSAVRLHFQVHPSREFAIKRLGSPRGKTEAYVILAIRDDVTEPYIYAGFQRSPSREQLKLWIENQDIEAIESCFDKIPVEVGDIFLLPGGRPHALGEGILMLEIMEPSDLAVRFEFERCGYTIPEKARFMDRGIETALDVFNFDAVASQDIDTEFRCLPKMCLQSNDGSYLEELIGSDKTDCFIVKRAFVKTHFERHESSFFIGVVTQGSGSYICDGEEISLKQWDRFFIPAGVNSFAYKSDSMMSVLECYSGKSTNIPK